MDISNIMMQEEGEEEYKSCATLVTVPDDNYPIISNHISGFFMSDTIGEDFIQPLTFESFYYKLLQDLQRIEMVFTIMFEYRFCEDCTSVRIWPHVDFDTKTIDAEIQIQMGVVPYMYRYRCIVTIHTWNHLQTKVHFWLRKRYIHLDRLHRSSADMGFPVLLHPPLAK
jgi:hypothetical protein